jgi:hypothetical protein
MTLGVARFSKPVRRAVSGYLPYFSGPTENRTRISATLAAAIVPLDHVPMTFSGPAGESNPDLLVAGQASCPWTSGPSSVRGPSGNRTRPSALPRRCAAAAPTDHERKNLVIPDGIEPSLSWMSARRLCLWTTGSISDRGGRRTHKITRLSTSSLCQFAYPANQ